MDPKMGQSLALLLLSPFSILVPEVFLGRNNSGSEVFFFFLWDSNTIPPLDDLSFYWRWTLWLPSLHWWGFYLRSCPLIPERLSPLRSFVLSTRSPLPPSEVACFHSFCWPSELLLFPYPKPDHVPLFHSPSSLPLRSPPLCASYGDCFLLPTETEASSLGFFCFWSSHHPWSQAVLQSNSDKKYMLLVQRQTGWSME